MWADSACGFVKPARSGQHIGLFRNAQGTTTTALLSVQKGSVLGKTLSF